MRHDPAYLKQRPIIRNTTCYNCDSRVYIGVCVHCDEQNEEDYFNECKFKS